MTNNKKIAFEINSVEEISEASDPNFAVAKIHAFSSGINRHEMTCDVETLQRTAPTIFEKPVVFDYDDMFEDFKGHARQPFIAGFVVPDSASFEELEDGRIGLMVTAKIWKRYSRKFMSVFKRDIGNKRKVSVEMELFDTEKDDETGLEKMLDFSYTAIAVLGKYVTEASPDAHVQILSFQDEEDKEEFFSKYSRLNFSIPEQVRKNSLRGLELRKSQSYRGTSVAVSTAKFLSQRKFATPQKIKYLSGYFSNLKSIPFEEDREKFLDYILHGGSAGMEWSSDLQSEIRDIDMGKINKMFVYKSLKEANSAIRGIKPPVTLAQANSIARQAEAIGVDGDKNGWAIAISNFKKTHIVKNGKWVKKNSIDDMPTKETEEMSFMEIEEKQEVFETQDELQETQDTPVETNVEFEEEEPQEEPQDTEMAEEEEEKPQEAEMAEDEGEDEEEEEGKEDEEPYMTLQSLEYSERLFDLVGDGVANEAKELHVSKEIINVVNSLFAKFVFLEEEAKELREYKDNVEKKTFEFQVDQVVSEVSEFLTSEQITEIRVKSQEYSLETLDAWKNYVRSMAFESSIGKDKKNKDFIVIGMPFDSGKSENHKSLWK